MLIRKICVLLAISKCWVTVMPFHIVAPKTSSRSNHLLIYQSQDPSSESEKDIESTSLTRREVAILAIGGLAYGKVVSVAISKIKRGDAYPPEHESRVANVFKRTLVEAAAAKIDQDRPLRILEVGIGSSCRTIMRGLYDDAIAALSKSDFSAGIDLVGADIDAPSQDTIKDAKERLIGSSDFAGPMSLNVVSADLVEGLSFPDGYFDAITCSLVLCSVSDQPAAVREINRLLNRKGGTLGYVEHVAINLENESEKDQSFMEFQQRTLDPLQQLVAHNCHLHRDTDRLISELFGVQRGVGEILQSERFFVNDMWPVSCQCSGVVRLNA